MPQRAHQLPTGAVVARAEESAGNGAAPQHARLVGAARLQRPDPYRRPGDVLAPHSRVVLALRLFGVGRRGAFLPRPVPIGTMQLHAEMSVVERCVEMPATTICKHEGDVVG